jgi:hypothetical protein
MHQTFTPTQIAMDAILYWNQVALDAVAQDFTAPIGNQSAALPKPTPKPEQGGPTKTSRALAIVHLGMYDAYNGIANQYQPYLKNLPCPIAGASAEAAIAQAAFHTLSYLYPSQYKIFLQNYQDFFAVCLGDENSIVNGKFYGEQIAEAILKNRQDDNSTISQEYVQNPAPGKYRPDPLNPNTPALGSKWGQVRPFGLSQVSDFLASPPPTLDSAQYAIDYNDVKAKGAMANGTRTSEETAIGLFWAYDGAQKLGTPPRLYNQIVRAIAIQQHNSIGQNARLFALVNLGMADAGIQCWFSKYYYEVWRPVTGVRAADADWDISGKGDGNEGTEGDPFWLPYGAPKTNEPGSKNFTPNFPAYPSGHATFGATCLDIVRLFYNDDNIAFDFVSDELNGESVDVDGSVRTYHRRHFNRLSDAIVENARSRVYLGVHWQFDAEGGVESGKQIADYVFRHQLQTKSC